MEEGSDEELDLFSELDDSADSSDDESCVIPAVDEDFEGDSSDNDTAKRIFILDHLDTYFKRIIKYDACLISL